MKLNEKGRKKLLDYAFQCKKDKSILGTEMPEFELEDFITELKKKKWPTIELQLDEAKIAHDTLYLISVKTSGRFSEKCYQLSETIYKRIAQAVEKAELK